MLCCVPRKLASGPRDEDEALRRLDEAVLDVAKVAGSFEIMSRYDEDAQPSILIPCTICNRTFNPKSLEKHIVICERSHAKKRKPFDSAKQRIHGTELEEFLPKQLPVIEQPPPPPVIRRNNNFDQDNSRSSIRRPNNAWRQSRDEFLRALRAARGDNTSETSSIYQNQITNHHHQATTHNHQRPSTLSLVTSPGAPRRSNEKGECPTCHRQFGVKSYDRHVAFCKERSTRVPASPMTGYNLAKERLEARIKYKAPTLKNRKPTNREKYSPNNSSNNFNNNNNNKNLVSPISTRSTNFKKDNSQQLVSSKSFESNVTPKLPALKRSGFNSREQLAMSSNGPLKSRAIDRSNSGASKDYNPFLLAEQQLNDLFSDTSDTLSSIDGSTCLQNNKLTTKPNEKRVSLIEPPTGFDDINGSETLSDGTETNSIPRDNGLSNFGGRVLGRRVIVERNQALGCNLGELGIRQNSGSDSLKVPERKTSSSSSGSGSSAIGNGKNNDAAGSSLSLSSIISSDTENNKYDDDASNNLPSLRSFMKNDNNLSNNNNRSTNGNAKFNGNGRCSDDDLSSPESFKRKDQGKLSADSAYSSLNRKYSNSRSPIESSMSASMKLSRFCHECGHRFPDLAKFCCECGVKRLFI